MLLKFKNIKRTYAIGLRWAVDTRHGIELIADSVDMNFGFVINIKNPINKKLKSFALAKQDHLKAISLAGTFSKAHDNFVLVHRLNEYYYWLCVIREGEVWSGVDVPKATAGDFIGDLEKVNEVLEFAKNDFEAIGIDMADICYCTDTAADDFKDYHNINFIEYILAANKYHRHFTIRYLEPTKIIVQKMTALLVVLAVIGGAFYYVYHRHVVEQMLHQKEIQHQQMLAEQKRAKETYFKQLQSTIQAHWGYKVLGELMNEFKYVSLQSRGWSLSKASFDVNKSNQMQIALQRTDYGTVDTFLYAYTPKGEQGDLAKDNNSGTKVITFPAIKNAPVYNAAAVDQEELTQKVYHNMYKLISYMQVGGQDFGFQLGKQETSKYGVHKAEFSVSAGSLWKLQKLQSVFKGYKTLVVTNVTFSVKNYEMSWQLKGEIYA